MTLPAHFFIASDGALHDTRRSDWASGPLRERYSLLCRTIRDTLDIRAALRHGAYSWPGGYECFFLTDDGECICFACVRSNYRLVSQSTREGFNDGWRAVGIECTANMDGGVWCAHCNKFLSGYETEQEYLERIEGE